MVTIGTERSAVQVSVRGIVQGVGFRPFVYQLASRHHLSGWVCNTSEDVQIEIEGEPSSVAAFLHDLRAIPPPRSAIEDVTVVAREPSGYAGFEIRHSRPQAGKYQLVSPDIATCPDCLAEVLDPNNRRFRYPFTNCTNCGPRFTIIEDMPYDRPMTTMRAFKMCPKCQAEYEDPLDRRFHAQPNACPVCGPHVELTDGDGRRIGYPDVLRRASELLREGRILAIKGLGGFLLACDATNQTAVALLRERKHRPFKPFAIMVATAEDVRRYCHLSAAEETLMSSPQAPIVLLRRRRKSDICDATAPNLGHLGVMLPYTPLHHILLRECGRPLVMTSGNLSEEPIAKDNDEALRRLGKLADFFVLHNRDIYARYDDSVATVVESKAVIVRRARSYAPHPVSLPFDAGQVLACGPELKNTFCLTRDRHAFVSQHIGDLQGLETLEHFEDTLAFYRRLFRVEPAVVACDMHPDYLTSKFAAELSERAGLPLVRVQHHHAHVAGCMADNSFTDPVIGVALDGTGYGTDGNIWGAEFMACDLSGFSRKGHLEYLPLPGGEAAIRKPYRTALGYMVALLGERSLECGLPFLRQLDPLEIELVRKQVRQGINSPLTSSCGRLFDAVSAILGICSKVDYEGQAAIELETTARRLRKSDGAYPYDVVAESGTRLIKVGRLLEAIVAEALNGTPASLISARFHLAMSRIVADMCRSIADETGIETIALSGGVFQNRLLLGLAVKALRKQGFRVLTHHQVPCNDGGVSLGQAVIAAYHHIPLSRREAGGISYSLSLDGRG